jgi:hypothetical protein
MSATSPSGIEGHTIEIAKIAEIAMIAEIFIVRGLNFGSFWQSWQF